MLADPVTVAASSPTPALVLAVVKSDGYGSERVDTGGNGYVTVIKHERAKNLSGVNRHYVQVTQTKNITDPYTGLVRSSQASVSLSITRPVVGWADVDIVALAKAITDFRDDSEVTTARLLQFQS